MIPQATKKRLPQYLRVLQELKERGNKKVYSYQIGNMMEISETTVRKDFMFLNTVGKSAYGYDVSTLIKTLEQEMLINHQEKLVLIGVGSLGTALLKYNFMSNRIGKIVCGFDVDPQKVNKKNYGVPIHDMAMIHKKMPKNVSIALLAIPKEELDGVINQLINLKIQSFINFSDGLPRKRKNVKVYSIDLVEAISKAIYEMKSKNTSLK